MTVGPCVWYVSKYVSNAEPGTQPGRPLGIMRALAGHGVRAVIVTSSTAYVGDESVSIEDPESREQNGVAVYRVRTTRYSHAKSFQRIVSWLVFELNLWRLDTDRMPRPDAVIVSCPSPLTILNGLRIRRRYRCRLIYEIRDIWPLSLIEEGGFSSRNPLVAGLAILEKIGYRRADVIIGLMPNLSEHVQAVTGSTKTAVCIPMGVDAGLNDPENESSAEEFVEQWPMSKLVVGYVGSLGIANAMETFFQCVSGLQTNDRIHFVVMGDGQLRTDYVKRFGSLSNLTFVPRVERMSVGRFLAQCDIVYFGTSRASLWRFGMSLNKVVDYMLAAKPIVGSYSGFPSMINEADCGSFVPCEDVPALRQEILRYSEMSKTQLAEIGERGRYWLLRNRSFDQLAKKLLAAAFQQDKNGD